MDPVLRRTVILTLFPSRAEWTPPFGTDTVESEDDVEEVAVPPVTAAELEAAVFRMGLKNTAPGLDGVPGRAWTLAMKEMEPQVLSILTKSLVQGRVPRRWKRGKLVLLRKNGRPEDQPSAYRPIVLLDEACKMLERVLVARINEHLERVGPNPSAFQFGFRRGRSTIDAVARLRDISGVEGEWIKRRHGALSFHLTQILTGHGCFGRYLCEITRSENTAACHNCEEERDTAEHTLIACPAWTVQRAALAAAIDESPSLSALIRAMIESEQKWISVETFANEVISTKEEAERVREREAVGLRSRR